MSISFKLTEKIGGFAASSARIDERAAVTVREILSSYEGTVFVSRLESLHGAIFSRIPELPNPSEIHHLLVVIKPTLDAVAYVNELKQVATMKLSRSIQAGEHVYNKDIIEMPSLDIGVDIPPDCGFVMIRSVGWQRSLFYDFGPLNDGKLRDYDLKTEFAKQAFSLIKATSETPRLAKIDLMRGAIIELEMLLESRNPDEARYQEFLERNPWILGGHHRKIERHTNLDDKNIPDFTGVRHHDGYRDVIELKQPFLSLFNKDGGFSKSFNDAWDQAERYLVFARRNRDYLSSQKGLQFENPRAFLIAGSQLTQEQVRAIRDKESLNPTITVLTYESILLIGKALIDLTMATGEQAS